MFGVFLFADTLFGSTGLPFIGETWSSVCKSDDAWSAQSRESSSWVEDAKVTSNWSENPDRRGKTLNCP